MPTKRESEVSSRERHTVPTHSRLFLKGDLRDSSHSCGFSSGLLFHSGSCSPIFIPSKAVTKCLLSSQLLGWIWGQRRTAKRCRLKPALVDFPPRSTDKFFTFLLFPCSLCVPQNLHINRSKVKRKISFPRHKFYEVEFEPTFSSFDMNWLKAIADDNNKCYSFIS